jgi:uncharacterized protein YdeI (YjbR/CyaY-like superfamily)
MEVTETFYPKTREEWRSWLAQHHDHLSEVWLVTYRVRAGKPSVTYSDAVEEALCFGWIDSTRKALDDDRLAQRFSPRRPGSRFSQTNRERLARLVSAGRVLPSVLAQLADWSPGAFAIPDDIVKALRADASAWKNWRRFPLPYRRIRAAYVDAARDRGAEFDKRLDSLVRKTAKGKQFGYGIEDFY